jgi:pimeloyl-ACP methyl ester carboxylesterase
MPRGSKLAILCGAVVVAAACVLSLSLAIQGDRIGRLEFRIWRAVSSETHGGRYVESNGVKLYFETFGQGLPAVVVLHGGMGSIVGMHNQIRGLASTRTVIAVDSRGHGRSADGTGPLTYGLMADDTFKLLEPLRLGAVDIVGWSDGGIIGLDLAMHHPEMIRRLVAIGANFTPDGLIDAAPPAKKDELNTLQRKVIAMWHTEPHYTVQDLAMIKAPTLIIAGERDVVRREHTDALAKAIPGAREVIIEDGTHEVPVEKPDLVNALILDFLDGPAPPSK